MNEKKFHGLRLFKRKKKDANDKRCKMKKGGVITFFPKKVKSDGRRIMRSPYIRFWAFYIGTYLDEILYQCQKEV